MSNFNKGYTPYAADPDPDVLTEEDIIELGKLWQTYTGGSNTTRNAYNYNEPPDWYSNDYTSTPTKRKHAWVGTLLLTHTCYDCKHCGAKQEKTTSEYCNDEEF